MTTFPKLWIRKRRGSLEQLIKYFLADEDNEVIVWLTKEFIVTVFHC